MLMFDILYYAVPILVLVILFFNSGRVRFLIISYGVAYILSSVIQYYIKDGVLKYYFNEYSQIPLTIVVVIFFLCVKHLYGRGERARLDYENKCRKEEEGKQKSEIKSYRDKHDTMTKLLDKIDTSSEDIILILKAFDELKFINNKISNFPLQAVGYSYALDYIMYAYYISSMRDDILKHIDKTNKEDFSSLAMMYRENIMKYKSLANTYLLRKAAHLRLLNGGGEIKSINDI